MLSVIAVAPGRWEKEKAVNCVCSSGLIYAKEKVNAILFNQ